MMWRSRRCPAGPSMSPPRSAATTTASISNIELPVVPDAPTVPDTIAMGTIQSTAAIAPLTVDPNHTMVDEIKENLITMDE